MASSRAGGGPAPKKNLRHLALVICAVCNIIEAELENCGQLIAPSHLENLSIMVDTQMMNSCLISFDYVDESKLNNNTVCFLKAAYLPLRKILYSKIHFKENTSNDKILKRLKVLLIKLDDCLHRDDDKLELPEPCKREFSMSADKMLKLVQYYFKKAQELLSKNHTAFRHDCSSVFQKCIDSRKNETRPSTGVVTDENCKCPATSLISGGRSASISPTFESFPSFANQPKREESAASILQLSMLPSATQTQGQSEGNTRPRVLRSTYKSPRTAASMDFRIGMQAVMSSPPEEHPLATVSQESDLAAVNTGPLLDSTIIRRLWSPRLKNVSPFPASQQVTESMGAESLLPSSESGSSQAWAYVLPSQHPSLFDFTKNSPSKQRLQTTEMDEAITGFGSHWDATTDTRSTSNLNLDYISSLEPVDNSGLPSSGRLATLSPIDPAQPLFPTPGSEELFSITQPLSSSSPRQTYLENDSRKVQGSRGRGIQPSAQLRERRAGQGEEGIAKDRELEDSMPGPSFDRNFIPLNTEKHSKTPEPREFEGMTVVYVVVPSVLGILLAVGGLLFYLHKSRMLGRRRMQRTNANVERQEGSPLNGREEHLELPMQGEL